MPSTSTGSESPRLYKIDLKVSVQHIVSKECQNRAGFFLSYVEGVDVPFHSFDNVTLITETLALKIVIPMVKHW